MFMQEEKIPHSLTVEQTLIYAAAENIDAWELIKTKLSDADFYSPSHRKLFSIIQKLYNQKVTFDFVFLCEYLANNNLVESVGGEQYLEHLVRNCAITNGDNLMAYIDLVRNHSIERQLLVSINQTKEKILIKDGTPTGDILAKLENDVLAIAHHRSKSDGLEYFGSKDLLMEFTHRLANAIDRDGLSGVDTGLTDLNKFTDGLQKGDLVYIGARPSMGKTTLGMNIVQSALFTQPLPVVVFSMESPKWQIVQRLVSAVSGVHLYKIVKGDYDQFESAKITNAIARLKDSKLIICDKGGLSPADMRTILRGVVRDHGGVGLIMADYVQKMGLKGFEAKKSRNEELSIISADLKEIAKDYNCPAVVLAQLSKDCEKRPNKRPMMSDLRDCGGLEQDADVVVMLYRDEVYNPNNAENKGLAELIVCKNRNGQTGTIVTRFNAPVFKFENMANDEVF